VNSAGHKIKSPLKKRTLVFSNDVYPCWAAFCVMCSGFFKDLGNPIKNEVVSDWGVLTLLKNFECVGVGDMNYIKSDYSVRLPN
jgi:hypothetical protein